MNTTAKYLFRNGLRNVAIVVAREGPSDSAAKQAEAVLREQGKLVLIISRNDLCTMLEGSAAGEPPENLLFERMDDMLMKASC